MKKEMVFIGKGGQGLGVMGRIIALAAILEQKEVSSSPSYGGEVTGGLSQSEVIVSDEKIDFPGVLSPDVLVAFSQEGYDSFISQVNPGALIFFDPDLVKIVKPPEKVEIISFPVTKTAVENFGKSQFANIVMLGVLVAKTKILKPETVIQVIKEELKNPEVNEKAFVEGFNKIGG